MTLLAALQIILGAIIILLGVANFINIKTIETIKPEDKPIQTNIVTRSTPYNPAFVERWTKTASGAIQYERYEVKDNNLVLVSSDFRWK